MSGIGAKSQTGEEHVWRPNPLTHRLELPSIHLSQSRPRTRSHNKRCKRLHEGSALSRCQTDRQKWHTDWCMDRCISWYTVQYRHTYDKLTHPDANLKIPHAFASMVLHSSVTHTCILYPAVLVFSHRILSAVTFSCLTWLLEGKKDLHHSSVYILCFS